MQKIDYDNFASYFYTYIIHELKPFEEKRKWVFMRVAVIAIIGIILAAAYILPQIKSQDIDLEGLIFIIGLTVVICGWQINSFKRKIKDKLYKKLFEAVDLKYSNDANDYMAIRGKIREICGVTGLYNRYDDINTDDIIFGNYGELPFYISDTKITYETGSGRNRRTVTVFNGLFLTAKIGKNFKGETMIKTDHWGQAKEIKGKKTVRLEDIEFEKAFEVYGTDQIESRYLLTTAFMNRLLEYKKKKRCAIEVVFSNDIIPDENIFFFIHTSKDHFEIPVVKSLLNKDIFYGVIMDIVDALEIVETLKLDQNIGM